jgi:capsid protein
MITSSIGRSGYDGADTGRLMRDMPMFDLDPRDVFAADGSILLARSSHLTRNNAYARAMVNAMQAGVCGPTGLLFKSLYEHDPDSPVSDEDRALRKAITSRVRGACRDIDAAGLLSFRQWEDSLVYGKAVHGESIKVRVIRPRAWASHATCWRCIHPARICNPEYQHDTDRLHQGVALDDDGTPVGLHIVSRHPNRLLGDAPHWNYVSLRDASGLEQVIWHSARTEPEQIRAPGWFAPVMSLLIHLGNVTEAHVVAKRLQACLGMIIEVDDPVAAARKDRNGIAWTKNTSLEPGKTYYVKRGSNVRPFDFKYDGADFDAFGSFLLQVVCAAFGPGIPYQFAMQQLTRSNMASARAALMQAWRSFRREQIDHEHELRIVVRNALAEDLALGRLSLPTGADLDLAARGYFLPPQRLTTDDHREMQAAALKRDVLGISRSTLAHEHGGYDLDEERDQDAEDRALDAAAGLDRDPVDEGRLVPEHDPDEPSSRPIEEAA